MSDGTERWLPVPGWDGLYEVSDWGRAKSLPRMGTAKKRLYGGKILTQRPVNEYGHLTVTLSRDGTSSRYLIHRLVMLAFVGPCPPGEQVRHWDGHPANNRLDNLLYGTPAEDAQDKFRHGTAKSQRTHCARGHEYTPENTRMRDRGTHMERVCLTCEKINREAWEATQPPTGPHNGLKTHCPQGHEYTPENTYVNTKGSRECRICRRARAHKKAA